MSASDFDFQPARAYLLGLKARGVSLGLDRMRRFAAALGDPQASVPCIHIAGTNGKGSTAAMVESILRTAGWRTGLYTSPHLVRLGERIQVDRRPLTDEEIAGHVAEMRPVAGRLAREHGDAAGPSYFEFMTAMAFRHFARERCDIAVIEVGLGGRLDATNIVTPEVAAIASIGLDHCDVLGSTFAAIAAEKAGIVKPGRPVVIGRLPAEAESVVRAIAAERGAPLISVREECGDEVERCPRTALAGDYQRWNAATAALIARQLPARWRLTDETISRGLAQVDWPGRWQEVSVGGKRVILDTSHNGEGASVLEANLAGLVAATGRRPIVVIGVLGAARARPLLAVVARHARELRLVVPDQPRACSHAEMAALVPATFGGAVVRTSVAEAFPAANTCAVGAPDDVIVVTGSVYLAGEVMARLAGGAAQGGLQDF